MLRLVAQASSAFGGRSPEQPFRHCAARRPHGPVCL